MSDAEREKLKLQLMRHEGVRLLPYRDTVGKTTIGIGRNLTDVGITHDEAMFLLDNDIDACIHDLISFPWFADLDPVRQRVLVDLRFNLGGAGLRKFTTTLSYIASGEFALASVNLLKSKWAMQVGARAITLARMLDTGKDI